MTSITRLDTRPTTFRLETELLLPFPREHIFGFYADAMNLEAITPAWLRFRVLTPAPIEMREGALIDYRLRLHGIPIRWRTKITAWEPPYRFVDEQIRGPYLLWRHEHVFEDRNGDTRVIDRVDYRVPGGRLVNWLLVERDVAKIFAFRHDALQRIFLERQHPAEATLQGSTA